MLTALLSLQLWKIDVELICLTHSFVPINCTHILANLAFSFTLFYILVHVLSVFGTFFTLYFFTQKFKFYYLI